MGGDSTLARGVKMDRREFLLGTLGATALFSQLGCRSFERATAPTGYLYDDIFLRHHSGENHRESPARLTAIRDRILQTNWNPALLTIPPDEASLQTVCLVHTPEYVELVKAECESGVTRLSTGDTNISHASYSVALAGVGGVVAAVDQVMQGEAKNAFCAVRPPGHHASAARGMGFCLFNNVAIAARYAQKTYGIERVLIADWDVHHGNGTQDTFYSDGSVFFMSTHQDPLYPGTGIIEETGEGSGLGFTMNRPFPPGAGNEEIVGAFRNDLLPAAREFRPELTLISAGFDSRTEDPLGSFEVTDEGFRELTRIMVEIAGLAGEGRLVSVLEGGYNPAGLASAVAAHLDELTKA
jgi:acetoin utilization deacetylase AcuC-like enzyme